MGEKKERIRDKFMKAMELPKGLIVDVPRMTMIGNENFYIENYKGIIEYSDNIIRLNNGIGVYGNKLNIEEITEDEMFITGNIFSIEFMN